MWLNVWCLDCRHQVEPDPAEMAERYGAETIAAPPVERTESAATQIAENGSSAP
jgi:hypothetical protein